MNREQIDILRAFAFYIFLFVTFLFPDIGDIPDMELNELPDMADLLFFESNDISDLELEEVPDMPDLAFNEIPDIPDL